MSDRRELELCRYTLHAPFEEGNGPEWQFPEMCACCGGPAEALIPQRLTHDSGNTKWWRDISVPYCGVCARHVDSRNRSTRGAQRSAVALTALLGAGALYGWWKWMGGSFQEALDQLFELPMAIGAAFVLVVLYYTFESFFKGARSRTGGSIPSTDACTVSLQLTMGTDKFRLITDESKMVVRMTCANAAFAAQFAALNEEFIEKKQTLLGTAERTPRGDWVLKQTVAEGEPAQV